MRHFKSYAGFRCLSSALVCLRLAAVAEGGIPNRPNILWIIADDMGVEAGCYGVSIMRTPNLDKLALAGELEARLTSLAPLLKGARYTDAMQLLAELSPVVDKFFADVLVMADDPTLRQARLALLVQLRRAILGSIGDISELASDDR